jgi:hypothetical protein
MQGARNLGLVICFVSVRCQNPTLRSQNAVQFLDQNEKFRVIKLDRNSRAELVNLVAFRLVHRKTEVLQYLKA